MWAALIVGLLFLAGAVYNLFGPAPDHVEAVGGLGIAAALIGLFFFIKNHRDETQAFDEWLAKNAQAIEQGGARYRGVLITTATVLTRYQAALSFLIVTFKIPTRPYIVGRDSTGTIALVCTAISLLFGWWGLPWGPIYTIQVASRNLRGGIQHTVADQLRPISALPADASPTPKAQTPGVRA